MKVEILGSGTSTGVPLIGCRCVVCTSEDPKNNRWRASICVTFSNDTRVVVDTGPEFRLQALRAGISSLEHVVYTHMHADHVHGFDDLRGLYFTSKKPINLYIDQAFEQELKHRFHYAFEDTGYQGGRPDLRLSLLPRDFGTLEIAGQKVEFARMPHGNVMTTVIKFGRFLYATDFKSFTSNAIDRWKGQVDVMVASGLKWSDHKTHSTIPETLELFKALEVKRGIITHLSHEVHYARDQDKLPKNVEFAFDGMTINI